MVEKQKIIKIFYTHTHTHTHPNNFPLSVTSKINIIIEN